MTPPKRNNVEEAIAYGLNLRGAQYGWWRGGAIPLDEPAYARLGEPPSPEYVRRNGVFCAGATNVMRRAVGKNPPVRADDAGGRGGTGAYIGFWWRGEWYPGVFYDVAKPLYGKNNVGLESVRRGDVLARVYRSIQDQGHVAIALGGADDPVLQSYAESFQTNEPGCNSRWSARQSHDGGYYHYVIPREEIW